MSQLIASNYLNKLWITFSSEDSAVQRGGKTALVYIPLCEGWKVMENGDQEPDQQDSSSGQRHLTHIPADPVGQPRNGDPHKRNAQHGADEGKYEYWHLVGSSSFVCVPICTDPSAHIFYSPPGQQVVELQLTAHLFGTVKGDDEMENGRLAHVIRHVT